MEGGDEGVEGCRGEGTSGGEGGVGGRREAWEEERFVWGEA